MQHLIWCQQHLGNSLMGPHVLCIPKFRGSRLIPRRLAWGQHRTLQICKKALSIFIQSVARLSFESSFGWWADILVSCCQSMRLLFKPNNLNRRDDFLAHMWLLGWFITIFSHTCGKVATDAFRLSVLCYSQNKSVSKQFLALAVINHPPCPPSSVAWLLSPTSM